MNHDSKAVFLSYASQDAEAARRIAESLRVSGVEVWFDQNELVGGDSWDAKIRKQIKECALFVPIISANTQARTEGYFRLEWRLADQRTHLMAKGRAFLLPVVIDDTRDSEAHVPDSFTEVQWMRIGSADSLDAFSKRVGAVLAGEVARVSRPVNNNPSGETVSTGRETRATPVRRSGRWLVPAIAALFVGVGLALWQPWQKRAQSQPEVAAVKTNAWPRDPVARRAFDLYSGINARPEDLVAAESILAAELKQRPTDAELLTAFAQLNNIWMSRGFDRSNERYEKARVAAEQSYRIAGPTDPEALFALGRFWQFRDFDHARAEPLLRQALALKPDDTNFHAALVNAILARDTAAGLDEARKMAARFPQHSVTQYRVATHLLFEGLMEEGEAMLDRSLALNRGSTAVSMKALLALTVHGDVPGMRRVLADLPAAYRFDDRAVYTAYVLACVSGDFAAGIRTLEAAPDAWLEDLYYTGPKSLLLGDLLRQQGRNELARLQFEGATTALQGARAKAPTDMALLRLEAWALWYLGRTTEARAAIRPVLESVRRPYRIRPHNVAWFWDPIPQFLIFGERERALELMREAVQVPAVRARLRTIWPLDPRVAPWREDPEIRAILAEPGAEDGGRTADDGGQKAEAKSVAVLAFANLSDDKDNEYFSDGISEELLNVLAKVPGLKVSARTSAFSFKGKGVAIPEIAKQLGVAYVVEGSVRKVGNRVRITAQLIKAADGFHVWSDNFDRELKDIFAVQDEIAGLIAGKLQVAMGGARPVRQVNPEAYRLVLEGRHFLGLRTDDGFDRAERSFQQAAVLDPMSAEALAGLASVGVMRVNYAQAQGRRARLDLSQSEGLARKALQLDPTLADARAALGYAAMLEGRWADSEREYEIAQQLSPGSALWESWRAYLEVNRGRINLALTKYERAVALDPLWAPNLWTEAIVCEVVGLHARALASAERVIALRPEPDLLLICHSVRSQALLGVGRKDEAVAVARKVVADFSTERRVSPVYPSLIQVLRSAGLDQEANAFAEQLLRRLEPDNYIRAHVLAELGRKDEALAALENIAPRSYHELYWNVLLDPLRDDPRFVELLRRLGCVEEYRTGRAEQARVLAEYGSRR